MKLFVFYSVIFFINQIFQYFDYGMIFTTSYLDDLLFFPITLSIIELYEKRKISNYVIPIRYTLIAVIFVSVLFEFIIPKIDLRFTSDLYIVFYMLGAILYHSTKQIKSIFWCLKKTKTFFYPFFEYKTKKNES